MANIIQIQQVSPIAAAVAGGNSVIITGIGFQEGAVAYFGSQVAEKTVVESSTTISVTVPPASGPGSVGVTVVNPDGSQFTQLGAFTFFEFDSSDRAVVLGVSPMTVIEQEETDVTLTGKHLIEAYENGLVALRGPSAVNLSINKVDTIKATDESGLESITFSLNVSSPKPLEPHQRIAIQVLASRRPEARNDLIVESSKQMFVVLPQGVPVPLAYTPALSSDKPTMFVVLGRNLEGCTLEFGSGVKTHVQESDEGAIYSLVTVTASPLDEVETSRPHFSILDSERNPAGRYDLSVKPASELKQSDPLPEVEENQYLYEGAERPVTEIPSPAFTIDMVGLPDQSFLGPTAEDSAIYDLRGELAPNMAMESFNFEIQIIDYYIVIPIINRVLLFPSFDGGGSEIGSTILAQAGKLFPVRGSGILVAARIEIIIHITVILIITIDFPWLYGGFNEFPEQFPNAIGTIVIGIIIYIEIIFIISFLTALVLPDGSLRLLFVFNLVIGVDFTISTNGRELHFIPHFYHSVRYFGINPFTDQPLLCDGRFQLADDNGQTVFTDSYGGRNAYYYAHTAGACCLPWRFNLELVQFSSGGEEHVLRSAFDSSICLNAAPSSRLLKVTITSVPPPQGFPPTLTMDIADFALIKAIATPLNPETGEPTGEPPQDLRDLGYTVDFFEQLPDRVLDPTALLPGDAIAVTEGNNIIRAATTEEPIFGPDEETGFWFGSIFGFNILQYLSEGQQPRLEVGGLPVTVNPSTEAIRVETVLAYKDENNNLVPVPEFQNSLQPTTKVFGVDRYEPFEETAQRDYVLAMRVEIPESVHLPVTLNFTVKPPNKLKLFADTATSATQAAPLGNKFGGNRNSDDAKEFFTGSLVEATQAAPVTASLTFTSRPAAAPDNLFELQGLKVRPNVIEADASGSIPKKLVPPGKNVAEEKKTQSTPPAPPPPPSIPPKNVLLSIPLECRPRETQIDVSFPHSQLNVAVVNNETWEEYLRVFKPVQTILSDAGNYFRDFAKNLLAALVGGGAGQVNNVLKTHGETLWNNAALLVQEPPSNPYLDDRPLYWARLQGVGAIRAYAKRTSQTEQTVKDWILRFERASRGLDVADGGIKFTSAPAGARKVIVTGFDPFGLRGTSTGQSNPSGLIALAYDGVTITIPDHGDFYVRTAMFPVRFDDFNKSMVENAIASSLGSVAMIISCSQNGDYNYYDVERWAAKFRADFLDNNNVPGQFSVMGLNSSDEFLESTLPYELVITSEEELNGPNGMAPFVIDQSYKINDETGRFRWERRYGTPQTPEFVNMIFRPEPLKTDPAGHIKMSDGPKNRPGEGSGDAYLSNEIFYRMAVKRKAERPNLATGHFHVPGTGFNPRTTGAQLLIGAGKAFGRFFRNGYRFSGPRSIDFPVTIIGSNADKTLTVKNESNETLKIETINIAAPFSLNFPGQSPLPITVNAGASVSIPLRFTPTAADTYNGQITLRETSGEILLVAALTGRGVSNQPPPVISNFTPTVVSWGDFVTVNGQYFTTTTGVKIGNREVDFTIVSDTQLVIGTENLAARINEEYSISDESAIPPNGTGWITGYIKVTTVFGTATSATTLRIVF